MSAQPPTDIRPLAAPAADALLPAPQVAALHARIAELEAALAAAEDLRYLESTQAHFADQMRWVQGQSLADWADSLLAALVPHVGGWCAAIYVPEGNGTQLRRVGAYAAPEGQPAQLDVQYGLLGQVAREKTARYLSGEAEALRELPSATATLRTQHLAIVPLLQTGTLQGVLEVASAEALPPRARQLLDLLSERMAATLAAIGYAERTAQLYAEAQEAAEAMRAQEEELRQNLEELAATQDEMRRTQEALQRQAREQEQLSHFLNNVLDNLPIGCFVKEAAELRFVRFNRTSQDIFGFDRQSILGKNDRDLFPGPEVDGFEQNDRDVLEGRVPVFRVDEEVTVASGAKRVIRTTKLALHDAEGRPAYLMGTSQDVTDETLQARQLEGRIAEANQLSDFLDQVLDQLPIGCFIKDAGSLQFVRVNQQAEALLGHPRAVLLGRSDRDISPAEADAFELRDRQLLAGDTAEIEFTDTVSTPAGARTVRSLKRLLHGPDGQPRYILTTLQDVTGWSAVPAEAA